MKKNTRDFQQYKFGGKELITANGLNEYDFGARRYYSAVPHFTSIDPLCEKYYWLSPYVYCANNPVNFVDPTGKDTWNLDSEGHVINHEIHDNYDEIIINDENDEPKSSWRGDYGSITMDSSIMRSDESGNSVFIVNNDNTAKDIFEFLTKKTSVEWQQLITEKGYDQCANYISTSHNIGNDRSAYDIITGTLSSNGKLVVSIKEAIHSHPKNIPYPSGLNPADKEGDVFFARWLDKLNGSSVIYKIFIPKTGKYILYNANSKEIDFIATYPEM